MMTDAPSRLVRHAVDPEYADVYALIDRWKTETLLTGTSLIDPSVLAWTPPAATELYRRIALAPDLSKDTFTGKLVGQLEGATQEEHLLLADLLLVHLLATNNIGLEKKLAVINAVGALAPEPFGVPEAMHSALRRGPVNAGIGFLTLRFWIASFMIAFAARWTPLEREQRASLLSDPWELKRFIADVPGERDQSQRNALLFLLFPKTFEDITSNNHKRRIVEAHAEIAGGDPDLDRQLLAAREALEAQFGSDFNWYNPQVRSTWDSTAAPKPVPADTDGVDLLRRHLQDEGDLSRFAHAVADAIVAAHEVNPASWTLNRRSGGPALSVGPNHVLAVHRGKVTVSVIGEPHDFLDFPVLADAKVSPCNFPTGAKWVTFDKGLLADALDAVEDAWLETVSKTAASDSPFRRFFAEDLVVGIEALTGRELPRPELAGDAAGSRAWIVRMKRDGVREVAGALRRGDCRIYWQIDLAAGSSLADVKQTFLARDPELNPHQLGNQAGQVHRFITKMEIGDFVLTPDGDDIYIGEVTSDARFESGEWIRDVEWVNTDAPAGRDTVSTALYARLRTLLTVTELSDLVSEISSLVAAAEGVTDVPVIPAQRAAEVALRAIDSDLARELHLERSWLQEMVDLLGRRRQLIFYGPPGTGKTYLAEELAKHLVEDPSNYRVVQFHPSYSYEDFVEGFRPVVDDNGGMRYELKPGPLKQLAEEARANPGDPFILIVDEINRGNLAKIFGELYYLLEYRDRSIVLQYGTGVDDEFSLPTNLFLIGTMNTADRSIALVDAAIRRRFGFVEFSPFGDEIGQMLRSWLHRQNRDDLPARLLDELNNRLDDRDLAVGPSYLMKPDSADDAGLERIWKYEILPLLTEQFYGRPEAVERFELSALMQAITPEPAAPAEDASQAADGEGHDSAESGDAPGHA